MNAMGERENGDFAMIIIADFVFYPRSGFISFHSMYLYLFIKFAYLCIN